MSEEKLPNIIILDIESRNHLEKDCGGDVSKLKIGIAGIKFFSQDKMTFAKLVEGMFKQKYKGSEFPLGKDY